MFWTICVLSAAVGGASDNAGFDTAQATRLLVECRYARPAGLSRLWNARDGLPAPDDSSFAAAAARFPTEHPEPSATEVDNKEWALESVASRQCKLLAWLADGDAAARLPVADLAVRQARHMTWTLPVRSGNRPRADQAFYAAATSLALSGQILHRAAPTGSLTREVALQWTRVGRGQLATHGPRGERALAAAAEAVVGAVPIEASLLELQTDVAGFFAQLDLDRPDMADVARAVRARDFAAAEAAYVSVLARRFSRDRHWPDVDFSREESDLAEADDICRNVFILQAHMYRRYDFGDEVDWSLVVDNDIESRVWMNAHPWMWTLLRAYRATGDEKYVAHLCRLLNSWHQASPPTFTRTSAQWRTLEAGNRMGQKWSAILLGLADNPRFQREGLFVMARSMLDHGRYLTMYAAGGGNWLQVESSGLACVATFFPEFRLSPLFYDVAISRLSWVNARSFLADGFQSECSPGYHRLPLVSMSTALRLAHHRQLPLPRALLEQYEAALAALEQITYPDGTLPILSDYSPQRWIIADTMRVGLEMFGREDFRWFATSGREGSPPPRCSHDFTHAGYCVMRDRWGADGQMLVFDAGYFGAGHQHEDKLNVVFYAQGRELIGDPGIYSYNRDEMEPYWRGTWSHNTITVDDLSQHRALGPAETIPDPDRRFVRGDGFDFAVGWYRDAWSPRGSAVWQDQPRKGVSDRDAATRRFQHQRCIFYRKGRYAVVADRVLGENQHQVDLHFQLAPIVQMKAERREVRPVTVDVLPDGRVMTRENELGNVAVLPAQPDQTTVLDLVGQKKPMRGWFALYGIQPSHQIVYRRQTALPVHFETVVQPLPPGRANPMRVEPREVTDVQPADTVCTAVACGDDLLLLSYTGPAQIRCGAVRFHGTAALVIRDEQGVPQTVMLVDGRRLEIAGKPVYSVDTPKESVTVELR